nr:PREDICTED: cysteine-rich secretory protein 2-like isoform X1 [Linepithema humile]
MTSSRVSELHNGHKCILRAKRQTVGCKQPFKLDTFKYLAQFCFVSLVIPRIHAHPKCEGVELSENEDITCDIIRDILDTHNRIRQSIAEGSINAQPPAANMRELYWDRELASGAQNWANQCTFAHNDAKDRKVALMPLNENTQNDSTSSSASLKRFEVGQNIGLTRIRGKSHNNTKIEFPKQIYEWFDEHKACRFGPINKVTQVAGHYTQLVWANTYLVGCGYSQYQMPNNTTYRYYICHYGPTGNVIDEKPYIVGNRSCDSFLKTSDKYPNLCSLQDAPVICLKNDVKKIHGDNKLTPVGSSRRFLNNIRDNIRQIRRNIMHNKAKKNKSAHTKCKVISIKDILQYNKIVILF